MNFPERLQAARKEKHLTQEQVAIALGIAKSTYTNYEKGKREPDLFKIKSLISLLDVDSSWLLGLDAGEGGISAFEWNMVKSFRQLDDRGKDAVMNTLEHELQAIKKAPENNSLSELA